MSKPRAVMVDIPRIPYVVGGMDKFAGIRKHVCCPYCNSKIIVEWEYRGFATFGWRFITRCPHLRNLGRGGGAVAFYKNDQDVKEEEMGYLQQFGNDVAKIYKYWYFYPSTKEKCRVD